MSGDTDTAILDSGYLNVIFAVFFWLIVIGLTAVFFIFCVYGLVIQIQNVKVLSNLLVQFCATDEKNKNDNRRTMMDGNRAGKAKLKKYFVSEIKT